MALGYEPPYSRNQLILIEFEVTNMEKLHKNVV